MSITSLRAGEQYQNRQLDASWCSKIPDNAAAAGGPISATPGCQPVSGLPFLVTMESDGCAEKAFSGPLFARSHANRNMLSSVTLPCSFSTFGYGTCLSHPTSRLAWSWLRSGQSAARGRGPLTLARRLLGEELTHTVTDPPKKTRGRKLGNNPRCRRPGGTGGTRQRGQSLVRCDRKPSVPQVRRSRVSSLMETGWIRLPVAAETEQPSSSLCIFMEPNMGRPDDTNPPAEKLGNAVDLK